MTQRQRIACRSAARAEARQSSLSPAAWWLVLALGLAALSAQALGQDNPPAAPDTVPAPGSAQAVDPNGPAATTGVIRPPAQVDPGIKAQPPVPPAALPTPVIPPPGSSPAQPVQPK